MVVFLENLAKRVKTVSTLLACTRHVAIDLICANLIVLFSGSTLATLPAVRYVVQMSSRCIVNTGIITLYRSSYSLGQRRLKISVHQNLDYNHHSKTSHDQVYNCLGRRRKWYRKRCHWCEIATQSVIHDITFTTVAVASSTGLLLKIIGLKVTAIKIDPYMNIDAGTMRPTEHGEIATSQS
jgi:hypothetical protein